MLDKRVDLGTWCSFLLAMLAATATVAPGGPTLSCILMLLTGLGFCRRWTLSKRSQIPVLILLTSFVFISGITSFPTDGWKIVDTPVRYVLAIPFILILPSVRLSTGIILKGFVIGALLSGLVGIYQIYFGGHHRATGSIFIIYFGILAVLQALASICASVYFKDNNRFWFALSIMGILLGLTGSILSETRGAWIAFPPTALFIAFLSINKLTFRAFVLLTAFIACATAISYTTIPAVKERTDQIFQNLEAYQEGNKNTSVGLRFEMWRAAIREFQESPLIGLGYKKRGEYREQLIQEGFLVSNDGSGSAHNEFFDAMGKRGLLGILAVLSLYFIPTWIFLTSYLSTRSRETKIVAITGLSIVLVYFIAGLTERFLFHHTGAMFYIFLVSGLWIASKQGSCELDNYSPVRSFVINASSEKTTTIEETEKVKENIER